MFYVKNVDARHYIIPGKTCRNKLNKAFLNTLIRGFWIRSTMSPLDLLTVSAACANYSAVEKSAVGLCLYQKAESGAISHSKFKDACECGGQNTTHRR